MWCRGGGSFCECGGDRQWRLRRPEAAGQKATVTSVDPPQNLIACDNMSARGLCFSRNCSLGSVGGMRRGRVDGFSDYTPLLIVRQEMQARIRVPRNEQRVYMVLYRPIFGTMKQNEESRVLGAWGV